MIETLQIKHEQDESPPTTSNHNKDNDSTDEPSLSSSISSLINQWNICISELQRLQTASDSASLPIRGLNSLLRVQQRALDKVIQKQSSAINPAQFFGMKSCCWEDKWAVVKKCRGGLVCINKDFPRSPRMPVASGEGWLSYKDNPFQEKTVTVDAVVDSGATWIKFMSISAKNLEYQVVTEGWESDNSEEGGDGQGEGLGNTEFAEGIRKIVLAARWNHCRHLHLLLPSLTEGKSEVVDRMLTYIRGTMGGPDVRMTLSCARSALLAGDAPDADEAIAKLVGERDPLVGDDCGRISKPTANLDPSALVALVTDLHHGPVEGLQPVAQQQIIRKSVLDHETDNNELVSRQDILATVLYPALRGRKLVCTRFAAKYFRRLIEAISTRSEEERGKLILPAEDGQKQLTADEIRAELQRWSNVPVPEDLNLPVEIVDDVNLEDVEGLVEKGKLPPMALGVARDLSRLNRSVYMYGWAHDMTTITGHRGIERQIQLSLATHYYAAVTSSEPGNNERPPDIWHRHLGGYLIHRDKPKNWREMLGEGGEVEVPPELMRWTNPWTTWGRGISTYGLPDTKTWDGVGHDEKQSYGRRMSRREKREQEGLLGEGDDDESEGEEEQS
ncbi:hypothetical protein B0H66DRAFT_515618 [Apodospora peruviana]|uniref:DUF1308 domain-containing protein n=1 Tax=Apodospora peruviana TaxID=516989 RepID=A0AAE0M807_9PEZI|nr:hypothetical protein B0H66DRAFT_515618 [Apodospora peruviana]